MKGILLILIGVIGVLIALVDKIIQLLDKLKAFNANKLHKGFNLELSVTPISEDDEQRPHN